MKSDIKICTKCNEERSKSLFYKREKAKDGLVSVCKICSCATGKKYREANKKSISEKNKKWYETNKEYRIEKAKRWNLENKDKFLNNVKKYMKNNKGKANFWCRSRQIKKLLATPFWADTTKIKQIYIDCALISEMTGVIHHVDHILPLRGKDISGLHVEYNLQILPAHFNQVKSNKLIETL